MGRADYYEDGGWNARCSMCGFKRKASQLVRNWQGQWRCREHDEPRHPQDFVRAVPDVQTPPWTQPGSADIEISVCDLFGISSIADYAVADCSVCDTGSLGIPSVVPVAGTIWDGGTTIWDDPVHPTVWDL